MERYINIHHNDKKFLCYFSANAKILFGKEPPFTSKLMATTDIAAGEVIE